MLYISQRQRTADNFIFRFTSDNKQNNQPALERILKFSEKIIFSSETTASMFVQCMYETDERTDGPMDMSQISMKWSSYFANTISFSLWITCDRYFWYFKDMTTTTTTTIAPIQVQTHQQSIMFIHPTIVWCLWPIADYTHTQPSEEPLSKRSGFRRQCGVGLQRGYVGIGNHENEQVTSVIFFLLNSQNVSISGTKDRKKRILVN